MDERQFQHLLSQTLEEDIPTVDLWNQLQNKQPVVSRQVVRHGFQLGKVAAVVAFTAFTTVAAYAFYQGVVVPSDPGITSLEAAEMLTYYDETELIEGPFEFEPLAVTLDYAYADANRLTVGYTVSGQSPDENQPLMAFSNPTLMIGPEGRVFDRLMLLANEQTQAEPTENTEAGYSSTLTANFIAGDVSLADGDMLDLRLLVDVAVSDPGSDSPETGMIMAGTAEFNFSVPFIAGTVIDLDGSATENAVAVSFNRAVLTPSMTRLEMCYALPEVQSPPGWSPVITLKIDGETVFEGETETYGLETAYELNEECRGVIIPQALADQPGAWTVDISEFRDLSGGRADAITGPWTFNFDVPAN